MIIARPKYPTDLYGNIYIDNIQKAVVTNKHILMTIYNVTIGLGCLMPLLTIFHLYCGNNTFLISIYI